MIPEPQIPDLPSAPPAPSPLDTTSTAGGGEGSGDVAEVPQHSAPSEPSTLNHKPSTSRPYRAKGKIPNLPKDQRDLINNLLLNGATYSIVIAKMKELGVSLNHENVSNWQNGGHQDWLYDQQWREDTRALQESALESFDDIDHAKVNQAALHVAALQIFGALRNLRRGPLHEKLGGDSAAYARLVNALSRATREALNAQKVQDTRAHANLKRLDPSRKASEKERNVVLHHWRDFFGHDLSEGGGNEERRSEDEAASSPQPSAAGEERGSGEGAVSSHVGINSLSSTGGEGQPALQRLGGGGGLSRHSGPATAEGEAPSKPSGADDSPVSVSDAETNSLSSTGGEGQGEEARAELSGSDDAPVSVSDAETESLSSTGGEGQGEEARVEPSGSDDAPVSVSDAETESLSSTGGEGQGEEGVQGSEGRDPNSKGIPNSALRDEKSASIPQPPVLRSAFDEGGSTLNSQPPEHCLECRSPLPPLRPGGGRPSNFCPICCFPLPPPGCCVEPSIEQCPHCRTNLPRLRSDGTRPLDCCLKCGMELPAAEVQMTNVE